MFFLSFFFPLYLFLSFLLNRPSCFILPRTPKKPQKTQTCSFLFVQQSIITNDRLQIHSALVHSCRNPSLVLQESICSTLCTNHTHFFLTSWIFAGLFLPLLERLLHLSDTQLTFNSCIFFLSPVQNGPAQNCSSPFQEHSTVLLKTS